MAFIDLHTGLGPYGVGEIMNNHAAGEPAFARVNEWFGSEATSTDAGSSSSAPVSGDITLGVQRGLPQAEITGITLEYGTVPLKDVFDAVRADNWLHAHGDLRARQARDIKAQIRAAFYPEADDWKSMVFERSVDVLRRAARRSDPVLATMVGYSGTPLVRKLGIRPGHRVTLRTAPAAFHRR